MHEMSPTAPGKMRVMHVVESLGGGVMTTLVDYVLATPEADHVVLGRIRPGYDTGEDLASLGVRFEVCPTRIDAAVRAVSAGHRRHRPDVVHAHSSYAGVWVRLARVPTDRIVYTPHCYAFERTDLPTTVRRALRLVERALTRRTAAVIAVSPREAELARKLNSRVAAYEVPNVARTDPSMDQGGSQSVPDKDVEDRAGLTVVGVGRISHQKDPAFFGEVAERTRARDPRIRFVWLGGSSDPVDEAALRRRGVDVSGWTSRTEVLQRLRDSDIYLHTAAWEGAPLTVLEAAQAGRPVVGRRIPALESLGIDDLGSTPNEVGELLLRLRDTDLRRTAQERSRQLLTRHQPSVQRDRLLSAYRNVTNVGTRRAERTDVNARR
jgi:glycosyltransferase involved in cell wall biosynthesis